MPTRSEALLGYVAWKSSGTFKSRRELCQKSAIQLVALMNLRADYGKLDRVNRAIEAQKVFIRTVPDPDNRERAEANLMSLVLKRDEYVESQEAFLEGVLIK